jgi:hypothetical protein
MSAGHDFALDLTKFAEKAGDAANAVISKICLDLTSNIILKTPVDTGRARANWQTGINQAPSGQISSTDKSGSATISAAARDVQNAPGNIFYITNNLTYIASLEFGLYRPGPKTIGGFSLQAPSGMVRISINEVSRALRL